MATVTRQWGMGMAISRHAISPAGDRIEILSDVEWMDLTGASQKALQFWNTGTKPYVFAELWRNGGVVDEKSGRATGILWDRMRASFGDGNITTQPNSFSALSGDGMNTPAFEVHRRGKRTYSIKLIAVPQTWYDKIIADEEARAKTEQVRKRAEEKAAREQAGFGESVPVDSATFEPINGNHADDHVNTDSDAFDDMIRDMQLDAPTVYDVEPPMDIAIASQVAMSLLTTVVEIISAGSGASIDEKVRKLQGDLADVMGKLSARVEDNDRMRRQLRQAGDEITALRHERDGLRSRLRATEANLTAALKGDAVQAINGEIQRRVESIMRVSPVAKATGDD